MRSGAREAFLRLRWLDSIVEGAILLLAGLPPLAMGAAHPWAYAPMEAAVFLMAAAFALRLAVSAARPVLRWRAYAGVTLPLGLFVALAAAQLVPLPPRIMRALSPSTYELYAKSLRGWPKRLPYRDAGGQAGEENRAGRFLPPPAPARIGASAPMPFASDSLAGRRGKPVNGLREAAALGGSSWRPLSVAPSLTREWLLKIAAYAGLFLVVLLYPFESPQREQGVARFYRVALTAVLVTGLMAAVAGIIERGASDGKVLGLFVPYEWSGNDTWGGRATGPFANPDHFANYLDLVLPLALAGCFFPTFIAARRWRHPFRLFCGCVSLALLCALVLSGSRAGWIGAVIGLAVVAWFSILRLHEAERAGSGGLPGRMRLWLPAGFLAVVAIAVAASGPAGRSLAGGRLADAIGQGDSFDRLGPAKDSLRIVADFPLAGVGLGCWPDIFPRYRRPPWSPIFWNAAHNDYIQAASETGLVGFALLAWFFLACGRRLYGGVKRAPYEARPIVAAVLAALAAAAFHEFLDFPLHTPANALLLALLLAIGLRMAPGGRAAERSISQTRRATVWCAATAAGALALAVAALNQGKVPYPHNIRPPRSFPEARALILAHPASSRPHLMLVGLMADRASPGELAKELEAALWLEPANPLARDLYAHALIEEGDEAGGLREITRSIFFSPSLDTHFYLREPVLSELSPDLRTAVERGFELAAGRGWEGAIEGFGGFYAALGRFARAGEVYAAAARQEQNAEARARRLMSAGRAYAQAREWGSAKAAFEGAASAEPADAAPYRELVALVLGPRRELSAAQQVVARGIGNGASAFLLYRALAAAREMAGDTKGAETALRKAVALQPSDFDAARSLGLLYLAGNQFDQAAHWLHRAAELKPSSAEVFFELGTAEERLYQYFAADKAYSRALVLAPQNAEFQARYRALGRKVAENRRKEPAFP